jgi:pimeloyl-ACP methyl ester carboxylesterase
MLTLNSAMRVFALVAVMIVCGVPVAGAPAPSTRDAAALAPELSGLGTLHVPVSTRAPQAHRAITGSRLMVYAGTGHSPHWEEPERFAADLMTFIQSVDVP